MRICLISTYPPRACGIATFAADLRRALLGSVAISAVDVIAITNSPTSAPQSPEVVRELRQHDVGDYRRAAAHIDAAGYDVVLVQHEYGIFGGPSGRHLLALLDAVHVPVVTTLHTVMTSPPAELRDTLVEIAAASDHLVVLAETAVELLEASYGIDPARVAVIPHGVPDVAFSEPDAHKAGVDAAGRFLLLTFGLLGRGKGIELVLDALPPVVAARPDLLYIVLGATHPEIRRREGETYRHELEARVDRLGLAGNVRFVDRFAGTEELFRHLLACDVYVTPYPSREQIVSGTLAYAVGTGRAVVSTPYLHAEELLADGRGQLVGFDDRPGLTGALTALIGDDEQRQALREAAYAYGRRMTWPVVAEGYAGAFTAVTARRRSTLSTMGPGGGGAPLPVLDHLLALTDGTGVLQHTRFDVPDRSRGYTTDDAARALLVAVEHHGRLADERSIELGRTCLAFLAHAQTPDGWFRNCMDYGGTWLDERGSEDTLGQALWGLAAARRSGPTPGMRALADELLAAALPAAAALSHTRAIGYALCGLSLLVEEPGDAPEARAVLARLADRLAASYRQQRTDAWRWFDGALTYANAKVAEGVLRAGVVLQRPELVAIGIEALDFVIDATFDGARFDPVGNAGWMPRDGARAVYDQQPIEAGYTAQACRYAAQVTGDDRYRARADTAVAWYLGRNRTGQVLYDPATGRCLDGLQAVGANANSGAESVICCLLGLLAVLPGAQGRAAAFEATA